MENRSSKYGERKCLSGDVIDMILDLEKLELSYIVNGKNFGVAFTEIEKTEYRAVVSANVVDDAIEFVSYQCLKSNA